jgi:transposase
MQQSMSRRKANCAADEADRIAERKISSCSDVIVAWLMKNAPDLARAGMETGPLAVWRWNELHDKGLPIV